MANPTVANILVRVRDLLHDPSSIRWADAELINWVNDGVQAIVTINPAALTSSVDIPLVEGPKQVLPATVQRIMDSFVNYGATGDYGEPVTPVDRKLLSAEVPGWMYEEIVPVVGVYTVQHIVFDSLAPREFYIYPAMPAASAHNLRCECTVYPTAATVVGDTLSVGQEYLEPLTYYAASRALSKDADNVANVSLSQTYYGQFAEMLGADSSVRTGTDLNARP